MIHKKLSPVFKTDLPLVYIVDYDDKQDRFFEISVPSSEACIIVGIMYTNLTERTFVYEKLCANILPWQIHTRLFKPYMRFGVTAEKDVDVRLATEFVDYFIKTMPCVGEVDIVCSEGKDVIYEVSRNWLNYPTSAYFITKLVQLSVLYDGSCTPMEFLISKIDFVPNKYNESLEYVLEKFRNEDFGFKYSTYSDSYSLIKNCKLELHGCMENFEGNLTLACIFYTNPNQKPPSEFSVTKGSLYFEGATNQFDLGPKDKKKLSTPKYVMLYDEGQDTVTMVVADTAAKLDAAKAAPNFVRTFDTNSGAIKKFGNGIQFRSGQAQEVFSGNTLGTMVYLEVRKLKGEVKLGTDSEAIRFRGSGERKLSDVFEELSTKVTKGKLKANSSRRAGFTVGNPTDYIPGIDPAENKMEEVKTESSAAEGADLPGIVSNDFTKEQLVNMWSFNKPYEEMKMPRSGVRPMNPEDLTVIEGPPPNVDYPGYSVDGVMYHTNFTRHQKVPSHIEVAAYIRNYPQSIVKQPHINMRPSSQKSKENSENE